MYSYGVVEGALALVFRVDEASISKLQARIKNYIRIGFTPKQPGKGNTISYEFKDVIQWAIGLQLQEFGLEPMAIKIQLSEEWINICDYASNQKKENDYIMVFNPGLMNEKNRSLSFVKIIEFQEKVLSDWKGAICINVGQVGRDIHISLRKAQEDIKSKGPAAWNRRRV